MLVRLSLSIFVVVGFCAGRAPAPDWPQWGGSPQRNADGHRLSVPQFASGHLLQLVGVPVPEVKGAGRTAFERVAGSGDMLQVKLGAYGYLWLKLQRGDLVQAKQSQNRVLLVRNPRIDFFGILRAKLRWGER